jgi:hypothetical protein
MNEWNITIHKCVRVPSHKRLLLRLKKRKEKKFHLWILNSMMSKQNWNLYFFRQTDRQTSAWSYSYLLSSFAYMQIFFASCSMTICHWHTRTFFLHNIANVILHTRRIHISFDHFIFLFFLVFKQAASIVFLLDIYTISLYGSHILLTFLSLNLVKRTLIEL